MIRYLEKETTSDQPYTVWSGSTIHIILSLYSGLHLPNPTLRLAPRDTEDRPGRPALEGLVGAVADPVSTSGLTLRSCPTSLNIEPVHYSRAHGFRPCCRRKVLGWEVLHCPSAISIACCYDLQERVLERTIFELRYIYLSRDTERVWHHRDVRITPICLASRQLVRVQETGTKSVQGSEHKAHY